MAIDLNRKLEPFEVDWCKQWTRSYTYIIACMPSFKESGLLRLLIYEAQTLQREELMDRVHARYSKLRRKREWKELKLDMEILNEKKRIREKDGEVPV